MVVGSIYAGLKECGLAGSFDVSWGIKSQLHPDGTLRFSCQAFSLRLSLETQPAPDLESYLTLSLVFKLHTESTVQYDFFACEAHLSFAYHIVLTTSRLFKFFVAISLKIIMVTFTVPYSRALRLEED